MSGPKPRLVAERFAEKVAFAGPDECWLWQGKLNPNGYGSMVIGSRSDGTRRSVIASRLSYELHNGPIPDGYDYERNTEAERARSRAAYAANPEPHRARGLAYYEAHRDERLPKMREYYQSKKERVS